MYNLKKIKYIRKKTSFYNMQKYLFYPIVQRLFDSKRAKLTRNEKFRPKFEILKREKLNVDRRRQVTAALKR